MASPQVATMQVDAAKQVTEWEQELPAFGGLMPETLGILSLGVILMGLAVYVKRSPRMAKFAKLKLNPGVAAVAVTVLVGVAAFALMKPLELGPWGEAIEVRASGSSFNPDPTGTWTAGDTSSVYSRLVVQPTGTFSFQTVDATGDVKGGYSGSWRMHRESIRFEWGGKADAGSCSGHRIGFKTLVFGSTKFSK